MNVCQIPRTQCVDVRCSRVIRNWHYTAGDALQRYCGESGTERIREGRCRTCGDGRRILSISVLCRDYRAGRQASAVRLFNCSQVHRHWEG